MHRAIPLLLLTLPPLSSPFGAPSPNSLKLQISREYLTFFNPLNKELYSPSMTFTDPLTTLTGISNYEKNIGLIDGKGFIGSTVFGLNRGRIYLHRIDDDSLTTSTNTYTVTSYWTLKLGIKILPWDPTVAITGTSVYERAKRRKAKGRVREGRVGAGKGG